MWYITMFQPCNMQQHWWIFSMYLWQWIFRKWNNLHRFKNIPKILKWLIICTATAVVKYVSVRHLTRDFHVTKGFIIAFIDINECVSSVSQCHSNATCSNTGGSFQCTCNNGFSGDGVICDCKFSKTLWSVYS